MNAVDNDKQAAEVVNNLLNNLPAVLFAEMRDGDWNGDPWGELMSWWFALNDVCMTHAIPCAETFRPSPFGPDNDDHRFHVLNDGIIRRIELGCAPTDDDVAGWHKLFDTAYDALKLLGKDY